MKNMFHDQSEICMHQIYRGLIHDAVVQTQSQRQKAV